MITDRRGIISGALSLGALAAAGAPVWANVPKARLGIQLYSVDQAARKDLLGTLERLAKFGYRDIELPGLMGYTAAEIRAATDKVGMTISSLHLQASELFAGGSLTFQSSAAEIAEAAHKLGARFVVLPFVALPRFVPKPDISFMQSISTAVEEAGESAWRDTAQLLNEKAGQLKPHGLSVAYHNHNLEFAPTNGTTGWDILLKHTDPALVMLELDLGWIMASGLDPVALIDRHGPRVRQLHLKDVRTSAARNNLLQMDGVAIGDGGIDWRRVLASARRAGVAHYYVEQEPSPGVDPFDALRRSADFLQTRLA